MASDLNLQLFDMLTKIAVTSLPGAAGNTGETVLHPLHAISAADGTLTIQRDRALPEGLDPGSLLQGKSRRRRKKLP